MFMTNDPFLREKLFLTSNMHIRNMQFDLGWICPSPIGFFLRSKISVCSDDDLQPFRGGRTL